MKKIKFLFFPNLFLAFTLVTTLLCSQFVHAKAGSLTSEMIIKMSDQQISDITKPSVYQVFTPDAIFTGFSAGAENAWKESLKFYQQTIGKYYPDLSENFNKIQELSWDLFSTVKIIRNVRSSSSSLKKEVEALDRIIDKVRRLEGPIKQKIKDSASQEALAVKQILMTLIAELKRVTLGYKDSVYKLTRQFVPEGYLPGVYTYLGVTTTSPLYAIFKVKSDARPAQINNAYKTLKKQVARDTDAAGSPDRAEVMQQVNSLLDWAHRKLTKD